MTANVRSSHSGITNFIERWASPAAVIYGRAVI
jgi:hypothetical protein